MKTAVITTVHGRRAHLRRQRVGLAAGITTPDLHVIVAVDDPDVRSEIDDAPLRTSIVECDAPGRRLPIARARNLGAATALDDGAQLLIFLDVDCIPGPTLVRRYHGVAGDPAHTDALLCGPVSYLPPPGPRGYPEEGLDTLASPHPARPSPTSAQILPGTDYTLFWSLSFAVTAPTWQVIGGFCERYEGYGGEDTDFAQTAAVRNVPLRWVGGAPAFHQYHPVSKPPVEHVEDIVRNARIFHRRWGWWPMDGWLCEFEAMGLIGRDQQGCPLLSRAGLARTGAGTRET
ncbi:glycosyltransferase family 2 protein [Mycobacterium sp. NPDC003323]